MEINIVKVLFLSCIVGTYAWPQRSFFRFNSGGNSFETNQFHQFQSFQRPQRNFVDRPNESNSFVPINQQPPEEKRPIESQQTPESFQQTQSFQQTPSFQTTEATHIVVNNNTKNENSVESSSNISETCLACICTASTDCNLTTECVNGGQYCGPFMISKPYWIDAGMLTLHGDDPLRPGAFEDCSTDPVCSSQSVRNYMRRFHQDCNLDGKVDCDDLGRIHMMGPTSCGKRSVTTTPFYKRFRKCFDKVIQLNGQSS